MKIIFSADWFADNFKRGAELNDEALLDYLREAGFEIEMINCKDITSVDYDTVYVFGNFTLLKEPIKRELEQKGKYIIYEHDHKYCMTRNPFADIVSPCSQLHPTIGKKDNHIVSKDNLINLDFYKNAFKVICLTDWHQQQLADNIECNLTNIHGSMWSMANLDIIDRIRNSVRKVDKCAVFADKEVVTLEDGSKYNNGQNIKNKNGNIAYCIERGIPYRFIPRINNRENFLKALGSHTSFCFFPIIPETCSRILVEARMLGLKVHTNDNSGAVHEDWFKLEGQELTDYFREVQIPQAITLFKDTINECNSNSRT